MCAVAVGRAFIFPTTAKKKHQTAGMGFASLNIAMKTTKILSSLASKKEEAHLEQENTFREATINPFFSTFLQLFNLLVKKRTKLVGVVRCKIGYFFSFGLSPLWGQWTGEFKF